MSEERLYPPYHELKQQISDDRKSIANNIFNRKISTIKSISFSKLKKLLSHLYTLCRLHYISLEYNRLKRTSSNKLHPLLVTRGQIYNALITENIGSELCGNHLVVIISNKNTNMYASKVNVVPIEGDGTKVPKYLVKLQTTDLVNGKLDKDPSRVIIPEVLTIDKARLDLYIGTISPEKMKEIDNKVMKQLK